MSAKNVSFLLDGSPYLGVGGGGVGVVVMRRIKGSGKQNILNLQKCLNYRKYRTFAKFFFRRKFIEKYPQFLCLGGGLRATLLWVGGVQRQQSYANKPSPVCSSEQNKQNNSHRREDDKNIFLKMAGQDHNTAEYLMQRFSVGHLKTIHWNRNVCTSSSKCIQTLLILINFL